MSNLVARIMLALLMLPLAAVLYGLTLLLAVSSMGFGRGSEVLCFFIADVATATFVAGYWVLLWRSTVRWTSNRLGLTIGAGAGCALVGIVVGILATRPVGPDATFGIFLGGIVTILLWVFCSIFIWRESNEERAARLRTVGSDVITCPTCGYNMTGLRQTTCPECGGTFTIDQLIAGQPGRESAELEQT